MRPGKRLVIRLSVLSGLFACGSRVGAQLSNDSLAVLQVPYLPQSELLCGGAAIAMVERWWGRRGVYAEEFARLVQPALGGILTTDLEIATRARGWQTEAVRGTGSLVQQSLRDSVPVVALIQVARDRFHYVVIVGWSAERVVFHDPATAPFATLPLSEFLKRWAGADQWAMIVRPSGLTVTPAAIDSVPVDSLPCRPWLDLAADAANQNRLADAERLLASASISCPAEPLLLRELAGVRFLEGRHEDAIRIASEYLKQAPADALGWQLLASSRYLTDDVRGALRAWNEIGRPPVDLVRIGGSKRIRYRVLADAIGTGPGATLTVERLALAQRRIADIPALALANVRYEAVSGGAVELRAAIMERPLVEPISQLLFGGALRAALHHELGLTVATPLGAGEAWTAQWRWDPAIPRRALRLDMPARIGLPGVMTLETSVEGYRFSGESNRPLQRRATSLRFGAWLSGSVEAASGARLERWRDAGDYLALSLGGTLHAMRDRLLVRVQGEQAMPLGKHAAYARAVTRASWVSSAGPGSITWSGRFGVDWSSEHTPRGVWSIAGGDLARAIPLRAHALTVAGYLPSAQAGPRILHGGVAADRPIATIGSVTLGVGLFLDGAEVGARGVRRRFLDAGVGLGLGLIGAPRTAIRIDVGRALMTDHQWALSVGLVRSR